MSAVPTEIVEVPRLDARAPIGHAQLFHRLPAHQREDVQQWLKDNGLNPYDVVWVEPFVADVGAIRWATDDMKAWELMGWPDTLPVAVHVTLMRVPPPTWWRWRA